MNNFIFILFFIVVFDSIFSCITKNSFLDRSDLDTKKIMRHIIKTKTKINNEYIYFT